MSYEEQDTYLALAYFCGHITANGLFDDCHRHVLVYLTDAAEGRKGSTLGNLAREHGVSASLGSGVEHFICDVCDTSNGRREADAREYVHIVTLGGNEHSAVLHLHGVVWRSSCNHRPTLSPFVNVGMSSFTL